MYKYRLKPEMITIGIRLVKMAVLMGAFALICCGGDSESEVYTPASCEINNTAYVYFKNGFTDKTVYVLLDGVKIATLASGETSEYFTVSAGTTHTVESRNVDNDLPLCTKAELIFTMCSSGTVTCPGSD